MSKRKYSLEDIRVFLEEIGFIWQDKTIYNPNTRKYRVAKIESFNNNVVLCLTNMKTNQTSQLVATINKETFELWQNRNRINATEQWLEFLKEKENVKNL